MGDPVRAKAISEQFKNRTIKAIALYSLSRCANCIKRINCGQEMLSVGGTKQPLHYIVKTMMTECPKEDYSGIGIIPKEVGGFLRRQCAGCDKLEICSNYIAEFVGINEAEGKSKFLTQVRKCTTCDRLENCIHHFMINLKISKFSLLRSGFTVRFRKCNEKREQTISLDLPRGTKGSVGSIMARREKKEEPK